MVSILDEKWKYDHELYETRSEEIRILHIILTKPPYTHLDFEFVKNYFEKFKI